MNARKEGSTNHERLAIAAQESGNWSVARDEFIATQHQSILKRQWQPAHYYLIMAEAMDDRALRDGHDAPIVDLLTIGSSSIQPLHANEVDGDDASAPAEHLLADNGPSENPQQNTSEVHQQGEALPTGVSGAGVPSLADFELIPSLVQKQAIDDARAYIPFGGQLIDDLAELAINLAVADTLGSGHEITDEQHRRLFDFYVGAFGRARITE